MATKKVNFFMASKELTERVAEFMTVKASNVTIKVRREAIIVSRDAAIESLTNVAKSTGKDYSEDIQLLKDNADKELAKLDETEEAKARFTYTEVEKKLYKDYYKAGNFGEGIIWFFKSYGIDVKDTQFFTDILDACSGKKASNAREYVRSGATKFVGDRTQNDILKVFYGVVTEYTLAAGTLKPNKLPEDVVARYAKKNKKN